MKKINPTSPQKDNTRQKENAIKSKPKSILESFEYIVELAGNSNLDEEFFQKAAEHIRYASQRLNLTPMQTVLLSIFVDRSENNHIRISEIARYAGCRTTKILRLSDDVDVLEKKHYVRAARSKDNLYYRVPAEVLKALRKNEQYVYTPVRVSDTSTFFDYFNSLADEIEDNELTHEQLLSETMSMLDNIKETAFAKAINRARLCPEDVLLFIYMAHLFVEDNDNNIIFSDLENIYNGKLPLGVKNKLCRHTSELFDRNMIENVNHSGMACTDAFKLTEKAKEEFLSELNIYAFGKSEKDLIAPDSFPEKRLVYNESERSQVNDLCSILGKCRFMEVQSRLEKAGMRKGFCCLFYGSPGTGKTETVYQIARQTGRKIMRVDVDKIKSCWVGESEKNIKALFDRYRNICKSNQLAPILLFNEADAVLGVRTEGARHAVDKMENSIQNIILQEMETLEGIMIATSNLTTNLDKAFERRFLYKIQFSRPTTEARASIWQAMMPGLKDDDAHLLASKFDLSGGEIENIVRKQSVSAILSGNEITDINAISKLCEHERITNNRQRMGF